MSERSESRRNRQNLPTPSARRLGMAQRMPQLANSRALVFLVGGICVLFGVAALILDNMNLDSLSKSSGAVGDGANVPRPIRDAIANSQSSQKFYFASIILGVGILGLAAKLYHHPLAAPICALLLLVTNFVFFIVFHHSEFPAYYVVFGFMLIACVLWAIQAGRSFRTSYARMGRKSASNSR